jgi:hypothetical protein
VEIRLGSLTSAFVVAFALVSLLVPSRVCAGDEDNLDQLLLRCAPGVIRYLREKDNHNVGVLKFLVQTGTEAPTDNAGPLNLSVARRLEVALILANPDEKLGILRNSSAAVAESRNRRATHLTADGRRELFQVPYVLAWGTNDEPVKADAFVTGIAQLSADLATTTVHIQAFGKDQAEPVELCRFSVPTDARTLAEVGRSFRLRQLFPERKDEPAKSAAQVEQGNDKHPLDASDIVWEIYYDRERVPITVKNGKASVKGPKEGQAVWFALENRSAKPYGVVVRVNGESTLYRERLPSSLCRKWVLDPGERVAIRGFQTDEQTAAQFEVLSPEKSEKEEVNYGEHAGTFALEVFASRPEAATVALEEPKVKAVQSGEIPTTKPIKLATLQQKLVEPYRGAAKVSGGLRQLFGNNEAGLVVSGKAIESKTKRVPFESGPVPVLAVTVRYYTAGK